MSNEEENDRKQRRIEDIFILVSIFSLWPVILDWQGIIYESVLYIALAGLIYIFIRRIRRFKQARSATDED